MKRAFLMTAVFCEAVESDELGRWSILGIFDTTDITLEGDPATVLGVRREILTYIAIVPAGLRGKHVVLLRFVDEQDRYLPGLGRVEINAAGDEDGWRIKTEVVLDLTPVRAGRFRLLIELDGSLIGWIPMKVQVLHATRRES